MSHQYFTTGATQAKTAMPPMHGPAAVEPQDFVAFTDSSTSGSTPACRDDFLERARKSSRPNYTSSDNDIGIAAPANEPENPSVKTEWDAVEDLRKSIGEALELLVVPNQQKNEDRLHKILTLIDQHKNNNDQNIDALTKQFARLTLKLHEKTKIALAKLDRQLDEMESFAAKNRIEMKQLIAAEIAKLEATTDRKIQSVSGSIDTQIGALTSRIDGNVNETISELGRVISGFGDGVVRTVG